MPFRERVRKHGRAFERFVLCGPADVDPAHHPQARPARTKADSVDLERRREEARRMSAATVGSDDESSGEGTVIPSQAPHLSPPGSPLSAFRASVLLRQASRDPQTGEPYSFLDSEYARPSQRGQGGDMPARTRTSRAESHRLSAMSALSYTPSAKSHRRAHAEDAETQALVLNDQPAIRVKPRAVQVKRRPQDKALPPVPRDNPYGSIGAMLGEPRRR